MKGGNTDQLYQQNEKFDGRLAMAQSLVEQHPDICKVVRRFNRWQHLVDYSPFKKNKLIKKESLGVIKGKNEYGMKMRRKNGK
jgi:hypothetical protein